MAVYLGATRVKGMYLGEKGWVLYDETIISGSTTGSGGVIASVNQTIIRPSFSFGGGNGNYVITTQDGFDVISASGNHGNCHIGMSDATYTDLLAYSKIKLVVDYFNIGAQPSQYTNGVTFGASEGISATSSGIGIGSQWSGASLALSTGYSLEEVINVADLNTEATITNLSTQETQTFTYTKTFNKETNSTYIINGGGPQWVRIVRDAYGGPAVVGNIHIYVQ